MNDASDTRMDGDEVLRLERVVHNCADGFWECALPTGHVWLSARARTLLGIDADAATTDVSLRDLLRRIVPLHRPALRDAWRSLRDTGAALDVSLQLELPWAEHRWFRLRGALSVDAQGHAVFVSGSLADVDHWQEARERLQWQVHHDPLTGLCNRRHFVEAVEHVLAAQRDGRVARAVVLAMDFDRFKHVNDIHGHAAGDELLQQIGQRLEAATGELEVPCRFGGDEFAVLLPEIDGVQDAADRAERLHRELAAPYELAGGQQIACAASIGVLYLGAADYDSAAEVLRDADAAMYQAKAAGGSVQFFDAQLRERMARLAGLEQDLRRCLDNGELALHYQPMICLETGAVRAVEALARWHRHGASATVRADEFIPLAEDTGLIVPIGRWIAGRALRDLACMRRAGGDGPALRLALNVSRRELLEHDYVDWLLTRVAMHGFTPADVILEITETAFVDDHVDILDAARALTAAGFSLALDDFGTGQSSLNSLQELPIAIVKIDKKFIRLLTRQQRFMAIVHAIVALGKCLDLQIVAEGVESDSEVAALQGMECSLGQGYHFSRPTTVDAICGLLRRLAHRDPVRGGDDRRPFWQAGTLPADTRSA